MCEQDKVMARDWKGIWTSDENTDDEEILVISNIYNECDESYSRLRGLADEVRRKSLKSNKVSVMLVDCCVHKTSLREFRRLRLYTLSIENVEFVDDDGVPIAVGMILRSLANNGQVKCLHVDSSLFDGTHWSLAKVNQAADFIASTPLLSLLLTGISS